MANHGAKFVSANLNKSYGQNRHHTHYAHFNGGGGSYGQAAAAGRGRPGSGSGGGMLILSRNRGGAQKVASKLSVPPPLNLPSLRKEHEKFDMSGTGGPGSCAGSGNGPRPTSSGLGWTKPIAAATAFPENNDSSVDSPGVDGMDDAAGASRGTGSYMPPSVRSTGVGLGAPTSASRDFPPSSEKAMLLRGEDFPSLQAARPASSGTSQKQKDGSDQKHKQVIHEKLTQDKDDIYHLGPLADVHTLGQSLGNTNGKRSVENGSVVHGRIGGRMTDQTRKQEGYFPDPLPLVHMNPRSDWADDERDTSHGFLEQRRDTGYSNSESFWDRDFDLPRTSVLPQKPASNQYERWGQQDNGTGKNFSTEVPKMDAYNKNVKAPSWEGKEVNSWRTSPLSKDGFSSQEVRSYGMDIGSRMASNSNMLKEDKYILPHHGNTVRDSSTILSRESTFGRRNLGHLGQHIQENTSVGSFDNRVTIRNSRDHHVPEHSNGYRSDNFQNSALSKPSPVSSVGRPSIDPIPPMGWDKRFSKNDNPFSEDPFLGDFGSAGFDERDIFSDGLVGVIKRKKDAAKSTDFHDPVRESFEAELERVQKMQELERQRIIEEQERALEQVRREEEERQRRIREEEEMQRRLEEEAREAALRAEMEQLEAIQRAEERRIAREEEKKRLQLEEERRKEAANLKLQELEARMAKRQAEASRNDAFVSKTIVDEKLDKYKSRNVDLDSWEDGERMLENVMTSGSFESYSNSRPAEMSPRLYPHRDSSSSSLDRGKSFDSWRRDVVENCASSRSQLSKQETGHFSPQQDAIDDDRAGPRKDMHGGAGYMSSRAYLKPVVQEAYSDEFGYQKVQRWNLSGNADSYGKFREMDSEFRDVTDKYGDSGWGVDRTQGGTLPPYPEPFYPNSGVNEYSYGRSRYAMRQPRVLPPPSLVSAQRTNFRGVGESYGPSTFLDNGIHYTHATRIQSTPQTDYHSSNHGGLESSEIFELQQECSTAEGPKLNNGSRCESQSSLSVSSPPTSPHLSHDELDESGDSPTTSAVAERKENLLNGSASVAHNGKSGNGTGTIVADNVSPIEDEEWALENDEPIQHQEEYDDDEGGYREEDEVREKDDDNVELNRKFDILRLEECESPHVMDNVVLGFDEGIEVVIPSVDTEKNIRNQEKSSEIPDGSVEERGIVDGFHSDEQNLPTADDSRVASADSSCVKVPEDSGLQGSIGQHVGVPCSEATTDHLNGADSLGSTCLAAQQTVPASLGDVASATNRAINLLSLPSAGSLGDLPTKLQFGLFSGPSLIPSPMPAIQIGSIQMPLHIHPPVGPSIQMHPSQPPMFQFGQLRYPSPISQGILPMGPQSMSFVQPNMHFNLNQNAGGTETHEPPLDTSRQNVTKDGKPSLSISNQPSIVSTSPEQTNERLSPCLDTVPKAESHDNNCAVHYSSSGAPGPCDEKLRSDSGTQVERKAAQHAAFKSYPPAFKVRGSDSQSLHVQPTKQSVAGEKNSNGLRSLGPSSGGRGRRFAYAAKNANTRSFVWDYDMPPDTNEFQRRPRRVIQRTEFRIRENNDRRSAPLPSSSAAGLDVKSNYSGKTVGVFTRSGSKRSMVSNRTHKQSIESESLASGNIISQDVKPGDRVEKGTGKDLSIRSQSNSYTDETKMRRNISEEDVDAPIQSGVVRVFKQPGIEAPSDEDDFIEVRSKRQMLNDRREQREKEIKAKARTTKPPRKPRVYRQKDVLLRSHSKNTLPLVSEEPVNPQFDFSASDGPPFANGVSTVFTTAASQPPIGTPPVNSETQTSQAGSVAVVSEGRQERESGPMSDSKNKVMSLSQKQIDEAMKPARYDSRISAVGGHSSTTTDPGLPTSSVSAKDKKFSSGASPINALLAGEKIQFGAVTSSTVFPCSTHVVSHGIGASGSNGSDVQVSRNFSAAEKDSSLFFEKDKHLTDSCVPLQGCEAEAEAAASAVAVAAISSDEIVIDRLGPVNDTKSFAGADIDVITTGVVGDQHMGNHSQGVELLTVSLPADLSVETTPISLWQPLPSPQSSSTQMLSHFPAGPPSHFPFYEMNPLLGGPIFAFSPHEESSVTQSQPPKTTPSGSGPLGNWQQCHSGVDSFYGPPAGYSGPFIGPPGVQAHPHMVVYNHFSPVGQYGQVGLSFMGTAYIPAGKQADWKSSTTSNPMHIGEGDVNNTNVTSVQRSAPMTAPIQHLAPGSPLLPMPPPLPMFDASSFQTASDLPVQARWGHFPTSPLHSIPVSRPSQSQVEGTLPSQANHGHPIDQSFSANRFTESRNPTPSDNTPAIMVSSDKNAAPFPAELGLGDPLRSTAPSSGPGSAKAESGKNDKIDGGKHLGASSMKSQFFKKNTSAQQGNNTGLYYQRGGPSQRSNAGNELPHRRMGFHGRKQYYGVDKGFPGSKMKQIYVAKQIPSGSSST